ncbi:efflux RND transporter periplasmic adaptor subunit [Maribacter sp. SA7]|uniref:efflux RND transporter periplasmic adaptor subunit n=1 Tax=Maribacter zhoushanensis TaxID=3030012 RepID=UPI0023EBA005|nr:efflux RND transporter periplasmic adaptor subunit [Maribacter zhoushanensis]MDF4204774.1 efflux RND transporter periplasmic adaptor subunit [Maribacter zhoushanensis]
MRSLGKYTKYVVYLAVLLLGMLLGYLFFGESKSDKTSNIVEHLDQVSYTCSMHPSVISSKKGTCPICGMDLVEMSEDYISDSDNRFEMSERAVALANVQTSIIGLDSKNGQISLSGEITSNDKTNATQTTLFDGRLDKLEVNYIGEYVRKGQVIGTIYSPDLYLAQDKLLTSASYKDTHEKLYAAARNTLGLWKLTDEQIDELLKTGKPIKNFPLIADVSGTVVEILASEGNYFKQGDPLFKVSKLSTVWGVFQAYENQMPLLKIGQEIEISSEAFKGETIVAKVSFIEPILDRGRRVVSVRADISNKEGKWRPGMFLEGKVNVDSNDEELLMVPKSAVLWTGERSVVYKKISAIKPVFELLRVQLGEVVGDSYIVLDGLKAGDEIVTNGAFVIDAAAQLQGKNSMMYSNVEDTTNKDVHSNHLVKLSKQQNDKLEDALKLYFKLKDELINSNKEKSIELALELKEALNVADEEAVDDVLDAHLKSVNASLTVIANQKSLEKIRLEFKKLSKDFIFISSQITGFESPIYIQHCPMADGNTGADWLSLEKAIKNPYFGDKMLTCGSVVKVVK